MTPLGFKRKEMSDGYYGCPVACCGSDDPKKKEEFENELVYPEVAFDGKQAEVMGIDDLDLDEEVEVTLKLKVKELRSVERVSDGKKTRDLCLRFTVLAASDYTAAEADDSEAESGTESDADVSALRMAMDNG